MSKSKLFPLVRKGKIKNNAQGYLDVAKGKKHRVECVKINERAVEKQTKGGTEEGLRRDQRSVRICVCMQPWKEHRRVRSDKSVTAAASLVY